MKNNPSKRHHYLPRKYLKGFVNQSGSFWIYDKQADDYFVQTPDSFFYENGLNTIETPGGGTSDVLEDLYTKRENEIWPAFDRISDSNPQTSITALDKASLYSFLLILHWRLPQNRMFMGAITKDAFSAGGSLDFLSFQYEDGRDTSSDMKDMIRNSPSFQKFAKLLAPLVPFHKDINWAYDLGNWKFFYTQDSQSWFMTGDNPIITEGINDHDPVNCLKKFVFPISGNILLLNMRDSAISHDLDRGFLVDYNTAVIMRAKRFVACPNEKFLRALVERFKLYNVGNYTGYIIPQLFQTFDTIQ